MEKDIKARQEEAKEIKKNLDALKNRKDTEEDKELIAAVEETRITLIDGQNQEYEFIIIDEFENEGKTYLALVSCDSKDERGTTAEADAIDDITVVEKQGEGENLNFVAVTDPAELLAVSKIIEKKFGHLRPGDFAE